MSTGSSRLFHARTPALAVVAALGLALAGCPQSSPQTEASPGAAGPAAKAGEPVPAGAARESDVAKLAEAEAEAEALAEAEKLCAKVIVVAHREADGAPAELDREAPAARAAAEALRKEVDEGADFVAIAERASDEARSKAKRAGLGTFARENWPERYEGLQAPLWALPIGGLSEVVQIPLGYAFAQRCAVDEVHTRHILVRYAGAKRADETVTHSKDEAKALALEAHAKVAAGADFASVAAEYGEDSTANKGGDLGPIGRGMFVTPYEDAAWALAPGELAPVTETDFGFHVIRREAAD